MDHMFEFVASRLLNKKEDPDFMKSPRMSEK